MAILDCSLFAFEVLDGLGEMGSVDVDDLIKHGRPLHDAIEHCTILNRELVNEVPTCGNSLLTFVWSGACDDYAR